VAQRSLLSTHTRKRSFHISIGASIVCRKTEIKTFGEKVALTRQNPDLQFQFTPFRLFQMLLIGLLLRV
jgi:hypothetical protein